MDKADAISAARQELADYLRFKSKRNTPERNQLLEAIYSVDTAISADELSEEMSRSSRFRISRATVYNNLRLFEDACLIRKVFLNGKVMYERTDRSKGVIRLICGGCGKTTEMNSDKVRRQIAMMPTRRFNATSWVLNMYGMCSKCAADLKRRQNRLNKIHKDKK
jgi:Fur family ferric uptake transcriptional regulator